MFDTSRNYTPNQTSRFSPFFILPFLQFPSQFDVTCSENLGLRELCIPFPSSLLSIRPSYQFPDLHRLFPTMETIDNIYGFQHQRRLLHLQPGLSPSPSSFRTL
ncbi:unnamed protein product [Cuscuta epithymum]|uniref:Uncharacterized protein n=1 Tax=Cuscuta epithymum TaxID=186058 RepID=A0AAV0DR17_9ASTE|nr:unnamed protein product [Cuscuta epithymum]